MLQQNDLILILTDMQEKGLDVTKQLRETVMSSEISLDVLKFINDNRQLDVTRFYERIRKNYNNKRSNLYKNLVREEIEPEEALITLSSFALQILLFGKHVEEENKALFFKHVRAEEVTRVLNNYYKTYDINSVLKLIRLIKSDLKAFEKIK